MCSFPLQAQGDLTSRNNDFPLFPLNPAEGLVHDTWWYNEDSRAFFHSEDEYTKIRNLCRLSCTKPTCGVANFGCIGELMTHLLANHQLYLCTVCLVWAMVRNLNLFWSQIFLFHHFAYAYIFSVDFSYDRDSFLSKRCLQGQSWTNIYELFILTVNDAPILSMEISRSLFTCHSTYVHVTSVMDCVPVQKLATLKITSNKSSTSEPTTLTGFQVFRLYAPLTMKKCVRYFFLSDSLYLSISLFLFLTRSWNTETWQVMAWGTTEATSIRVEVLASVKADQECWIDRSVSCFRKYTLLI